MVWAEWASFGFDEALFWRSTAREVEAVLERARERYSRFDMLAGLVASAVYNAAGKTFQKNARPQDFFRPRHAGGGRLTPEEQERFEARPLMRTASTAPRRRLVA